MGAQTDTHVGDRHQHRIQAYGSFLRSADNMVRVVSERNKNKRKPTPFFKVGSCVSVEVPKDYKGGGLPRLPAIIVHISGPNNDAATLWCRAGVIGIK